MKTRLQQALDTLPKQLTANAGDVVEDEIIEGVTWSPRWRMKTRNQIIQEEFDERTKSMSPEERGVEFSKLIMGYNHHDDHTLPVQLLGLFVWLMTYLTIPIIIIGTLLLTFSIITTPTADRSVFLRWLMEHPTP
jgi:hypothetical protein